MDTTDSTNEGKQEIETSAIAIPRPREKLSAMEFYEKVLGAPKYVVSSRFALMERLKNG